MALRYLQANINHCAAAQDLLVQSMAQWQVHVTVIAEPYFVPTQDNWVADVDSLVAIVINPTDDTATFDSLERGRGWVTNLLGNTLIIGVYFSPNRPLNEFEDLLLALEGVMAQNRSNSVLIAGDLNAKSQAWGSPVTNARGIALEDWIIANGLVILNQGSVYTCVRQHGGSIVDVTFASPSLAHRVQDWRVLEDVETMSDHRYIRFDVSIFPAPQISPRQNSWHRSNRWALKRLDREALELAVIVLAWSPLCNESSMVEQEAEWFQMALSQVCDVAMPRIKSPHHRRQVYWWSEDLASLRTECVKRRRKYTRLRRRRNRDEQEECRLYTAYRESKKALKSAIGKAKIKAREEFLESLNRDPWGRPYRVAMSKMRSWALPLTQSLQYQMVERVVKGLFPEQDDYVPPLMVPTSVDQQSDPASIVANDEFAEALKRLNAKSTAPGLDGVPGKVLAMATKWLGVRIQNLFSNCLKKGVFPRQWKTGKLVLLRKEGRVSDSPSAYRPIVLLNEIGKLFERIIAKRLLEHLEREGNNLASCQFGFRRNRSTLHAVLRVKNIAQDAVARGDVVIAVSLDISNAFNTLPWAAIKEALRFHRVPRYLCEIVGSYLSERSVEYPTRSGWRRHTMSCGVPQGSVLGPLLWNIGYDWVLRGTNPEGVEVTCYADDTLVTARGSSYREAVILATVGVAQVVSRIRQLGLKVALNKSEALCFHGPRNQPPVNTSIVIAGVPITIRPTMKYLGLVLDSKWTFRSHFQHLLPKLLRVTAALSRMLPNLKGPNTTCRQLYAGIVRSIALYGAPIWADSLRSQNIILLRRPQRMMAIRVARAYRTVAYDAACVLAGTTPWDLDAKALSSLFHWREEVQRIRGFPLASIEKEVRERRLQNEVMEAWAWRLANSKSGLRTVRAILPILEQWLKRRHGVLSFRLTQILTGHGCFGGYLCRIGREPNAACHHCGNPEDSAEHTLEVCPAWTEERNVLCAIAGSDISLPKLLQGMVANENIWRAALCYCETVMSQKESAGRDRELERLNGRRI